MTPTEKGRRRDALLYGFDTRLQLCDMIANREGDIDDLRAFCRQLWQRLRWADEVTDGGAIDARLAKRARELGVDE